MTPTLSIVIPTHDRPTLVRRAIASALAACPRGGEVVVVDDGSAEPIGPDLPEAGGRTVRVLRHETAQGAAAARNAGVAEARHEVVFFLDDDDELLPGYCDRVLRKVLSPGLADAGFSAAEKVAADGKAAAVRRARLPEGVVPGNAPLRYRAFALSSGVWMRRSLFLGIGGLDPALTVDEDMDFCCRLLQSGAQVWFDPAPGMRTYRHREAEEATNLTARTSDDVRVANYLATYRKNADGFPPYSEARWFLLARYLRRAVKAGADGPALRVAATARPAALAAAAVAFWAAKTVEWRLRRGLG